MPEAMQVEMLCAADQLAALEPEWKALWQQDPLATPFQSPEWLLPWWRQFGGELRTLTIRNSERLVGLLPFYLYKDWRSGMRQLLLIGVGTTDYLDGIFAPECGVEQVRQTLQRLCSEPEWDAITVSQLRRESKLRQALESFPQGSATRFEAESCSRMRALTIDELPSKIRRNVSYYRRRAEAKGDLRFVLADETNYLDCFDMLEKFHAERWDARGERGVLADRRMVAWHRESLPLLLEAGLLRMCCLRLDQEPIATLYAVVDPPGHRDRTAYFYLTAHSSRHAELSPGTLMIAMAIEHAAAEGVEVIDMLRGDERYKDFWHVEHVPTWGYSLSREAAPCKSAEAAA